MNTDIFLDNNHDILYENGDIRFTNSLSEDAAQRIKIRLLIFVGEWILDNREGVPYYQRILTKVSKAVVDAIFKAKILEEPLVDRISEFTSIQDNVNRIYKLNFEVILKNGTTVQDSLEITL